MKIIHFRFRVLLALALGLVWSGSMALAEEIPVDDPVGASLDDTRVLLTPDGVVGIGLPSGKWLIISNGVVRVSDPDEENLIEVPRVYDSRSREQIPDAELQRLLDELKPAVLILIEALEQEQEGIEEADVSMIVQLSVLLGIRFSDAEEIRIADALGVSEPVLIPGVRERLLNEVNRILLRGSEIADAGQGRGDPLEQEQINLLSISTDSFDRLIALGLTPEQILEIRFNGAQAGQNLSQALVAFGLTPQQILQVFPPPPSPAPPPIDPEPYAAPGF